MTSKPSGKNNSRKPRRVKAFKSCWTCRERKVSCDLHRPYCKRCIRSDLKCAGYEIKLIWTEPNQFDSYGVQVQSGVSATTSDERAPFSAAAPLKKNHQRRTIDLMRYGSDYTNMEDVEKEIALLDNPPQGKTDASKPWMRRRFGVFRSKKEIKAVSDERNADSGTLSRVEAANETTYDSIASQRRMNSQTHSASDSLQFSHSPSTNWPHELDILGDKAHDLDWFAAELRDDVQLSTLALQAPDPDATHADAFESVSFDDSLFRFLDPNHEGATVIDSNAKSGTNSGVESNMETEKGKTSSSTANGQLQTTHFVNDRGNDKNPIQVPTVNSTGNLPKAKSDSSDARSATEVISLHLKDEAVFKSLNAFNPWFRIPETGFFIHGLTRLLLNHYVDTVADKMVVVTVPKNPWRTIYFSRVLNALGDLTGLGHTSHSRNSLLNAILALSCFHLLNKFPKASTQQTFFLNLGIDFRRQASRFLKLCLQKSVDKEKYKDVLIAIISLSSVDVVWGTMTDCKYYLEVCEGFIETRVKKRPVMSKKAKALHSIFSFLKLIQDSTSLNNLDATEVTSIFGNDPKQQSMSLNRHPDSCDSIPKPSKFSFQTSIDYQDGRITSRLVERQKFITCKKSETIVPLFIHVEPESYYLSEKNLPEDSMLGPDALYGLPNSLIFMFANCVKIVKYIKYLKAEYSLIPDEFQRLVSDFEKRLTEWKPEWKFHLNESTGIFINDTVEGVFHHTMSFYYGLLIYFFTMARDSNLISLQGYAEKALSHLKALSRLREEKSVKVLPLMWQGFIAGCASISEDYQHEFRSWAANFAENGMGSYWGARQVMFEVWKRMKQGHANNNWYSVSKDWNINLMLF